VTVADVQAQPVVRFDAAQQYKLITPKPIFQIKK
jgi:hypothetical protein